MFESNVSHEMFENMGTYLRPTPPLPLAMNTCNLHGLHVSSVRNTKYPREAALAV